jgi:putative NADH-flavin reductase
MARITVVGGTGYAGGHIVAEAASRGHEVTSWSRNAPSAPVDAVTYRVGSVLEEANLAEAVAGADVVIEAVSPRGDMAEQVQGLVAALADLAERAGARLGVIGGAGSLLVAEGGPRVLDTPGFPDEFKAEANELTRALGDLRARGGGLDWFFLSPAGGFGAYAEGERTGTYRVGGDVLLTDAEGASFVSGADLAIAVVDEIEHPAHSRQRFTVAY